MIEAILNERFIMDGLKAKIKEDGKGMSKP